MTYRLPKLGQGWWKSRVVKPIQDRTRNEMLGAARFQVLELIEELSSQYIKIYPKERVKVDKFVGFIGAHLLLPEKPKTEKVWLDLFKERVWNIKEYCKSLGSKLGRPEKSRESQEKHSPK